MNRAEFLKTLDRTLSGMSYDEKKEILADYEEHFRMGLGEGKTEEEIAASLGDPRALGKVYNADALVEKAQVKRSAGNIFRAALAVVSLSFFNLVFVVGLFFGLLGALIGLWAAGVSLALSGVAVFISSFMAPALPWLQLELDATTAFGLAFIGLGLTALGVLACIGLYYVTAGACKLVVRYLRFNLRIIKGERL